MDFANINWRDAVLVAAVLIGIYLVLMVARLFQVSSRRGAAPLEEPYDEPTGEPQDDEAEEVEEPVAVKVPPAASGFARELQRSNLEVEVQQLRREGQDLRERLADMHEELRQLKATRNVSPMYSEAMALAQQGHAPEAIADRCDISLAEAELVVAMARGRTEDEHYDQIEGQNDYRHRSF